MSNLFQVFRKKTQKRIHRIPSGFRVYAVGDIHGRADLVSRLHKTIAADAGERGDRKKNLVVYLGDYLDRGPHTKESIDEVISGLPGDFHRVYLRGNHEQLFLDFLDDPSLLDFWLGLGGQSTLLNYGVQVLGAGLSAGRKTEIRNAMLERIPIKHLNFIKKLKLFFRLGDYLFVHAGIRPGFSIEKQSYEDLLWIRYEFLESQDDHNLKIVHGHTISDRVQDFPNRIGIDTGAYATGVLTCVVLEENRIRFLSTSSMARAD